MIPWTKITLLGDITITSVAALAIAGWLLAENEKRLALCWSLLFGAGLALVVVTKIAFIGWGIGIPALAFTGISGHAMRVAAVAPVLLFLLTQKSSPQTRFAGVLCGYAIALIIGFSRLVVHAHSPSEVGAGLLLGSMVSAGFIWTAGSMQNHVFKPMRIALVLLTLLPAPYVQPAPTQQWLTKVTLFFSGHEQPYVRIGGKFRLQRPQADKLDS